MDNENTSKLDALGLASLVLGAFSLLAMGGIIFLFFHYVFDYSDHLNLCFGISPLLSILTIVVALIARKRGSARQKIAATVCMIAGILGIISNIGYWLYFVFWWAFEYGG